MAGSGGDGTATSHSAQHRSLAGHKRKREDLDDERLKRFDIRPVDDRTAPATSLTPKYLLPRAHLPLSWLDPSQSGSRLYTANINLLESTYERGLPASVLVAEDEPGRSRYAVERASQRRYAVFRLVSVLESSVLARRAIWSAPTILPDPPRSKEKDVIQAELRRKRRLAPTTVDSLPAECNIRDAEAVQPAIPPSPPSSPRCDHNVMPAEGPQLQLENDQVQSDGPIASLSKSAEPDDVFHELAKQYLDALYLSKTSLAYFVKGPLSRARSSFPAQSQLTRLITFLREMLLSVSTTDQRLKKDIPAIINDTVQHTQSDAGQPKKKSRKKGWKSKRDRRGFFVGEAEYITEWWHKHEPMGTTSSTPLPLKDELAKLRTRETFLQVIITLEIFALESAVKTETKSKSNVASTETVSAQPQADDLTVKSRRKPLQLGHHLEALLDRLVIWHSIDSLSPKKPEPDAAASNGDSHDQLKSFCIEVIIPFFLPRAQKVANSVNKKLGGPTARSPLKRQSSSRRPGEPALRNSPDVRTSSQQQQQQHRSGSTRRDVDAKPPAMLHRSATDSQLSGLRHSRRDSSVSLSMASVKSLKSDGRRATSTALNSLTRREIDLSAASAASKEKLRKRSEQEAKVRDAIAGIRKPDRSSALQETAALVDAKFAQTLQRSRKPAHTTKRNDAVSLADVHIHATPRLSRTVAATPRHAAHQAAPSITGALSAAHLAPPTISVPQTGHRKRVSSVVDPTPSRGTHRFHVAESVDRIAFDKSPLLSRTKVIESTPSRPRSLFSSVMQSPAAQPTTPAAASAGDIAPPRAALALSRTARPVETVTASTALEPASPNAVRGTPMAGKSIYDALGWNDDAYEELV